MPRWNDETTCKFVQLYKERECLWDTNEPLYRDKKARDAALEEIVQIMGLKEFNIQDVKNKIRSLRATYYQELKKIEKSEKSGAVGIYTPSMKWFLLMKSILQAEQFETDPYVLMDNNTSFELIEMDKYETESVNVEMDAGSEPSVQSARSAIKRQNSSLEINTFNYKRFKARLTELETSVQELKEVNEPTTCYDADEECDVFGKHVAIQLKKLSIEQCIMAQEEIQQVLTRNRLKDFRK